MKHALIAQKLKSPSGSRTALGRARGQKPSVQELHIDGMNTFFQSGIVWVGRPSRRHACARRDAIAQKARNPRRRSGKGLTLVF